MAEQLQLIDLVHRPMQPPRVGHVGEQVFASLWEARMVSTGDTTVDDDAHPFWNVLGDFSGQVTQRQATAVASVVCWLGTSCGLALLQRAQHEVAACRWDEWHAYLLAWTLENHRRQSVNHGVRTVEYLMAPPTTIARDTRNCTSGLTELPTLSADELEAIDHLMVWLGTSDGQDFLRVTEAEVSRLGKEQRLVREAERLRESWAATAAAEASGGGVAND
jgi:hypothetical protein